MLTNFNLLYLLGSRAAVAIALLLTAAAPFTAFAGSVDDKAAKEVVEQAVRKPFPISILFRASTESNYIFRGVNILPNKSLDLTKANVMAINSIAQFPEYLATKGLSVPQFVDRLAKTSPGIPSKVQVARDSGIGYFDAIVSAYDFTLGGFYALQTTPRIEPDFFDRKSFFTEYKEMDGYVEYTHSFGPVRLSVGGTYYHVEKNSEFDTAEMNFKAIYSPAKLPFLKVSFAYDYSGSTHYRQYFDGHHLEMALQGDLPIYRYARFNPYVLVSAGSGIIPRSFNQLSLPTYFSDKAFAAGLAPAYEATFRRITGVGGGESNLSTIDAARAAFDPALLDRDFDLSNLEIGFSVPIPIYKRKARITLEPKAAYSRPLGNLQVYPYNQKDYIWGGVRLSVDF